MSTPFESLQWLFVALDNQQNNGLEEALQHIDYEEGSRLDEFESSLAV